MSCSESCAYSSRLLEKLKALDSKAMLDFHLIDKAIYWAKRYHGSQKRKSGELFYSHPLEVAYMTSDYNLKTDVIVASILHDIVEDTEVTIGMIVDHFSWRIAEMVDRLTRDRPDGTKLTVKEILGNSCKTQDYEVLLIKVVDRLHNMQTIAFHKPKKIEEICEETIKEILLICYYIDNKYLADTLCNLTLHTLNQSRQADFSYLNHKNTDYLEFLSA